MKPLTLILNKFELKNLEIDLYNTYDMYSSRDKKRGYIYTLSDALI